MLLSEALCRNPITGIALLRARRKRPCGSRTAEKRDELASLHSITSSARASRVTGISIPISLAVLRFITSSNLVGCWTGRSDELRTFENAIHIARSALEEIHFIRTVGEKATVGYEITEIVDCRKTKFCGELDDPFAMDHVVAIRQDKKATIRLACSLANDVFDVCFTMNRGCN